MQDVFMLQPGGRTHKDIELVQEYLEQNFDVFKGHSFEFFSHLNYACRGRECTEVKSNPLVVRVVYSGSCCLPDGTQVTNHSLIESARAMIVLSEKCVLFEIDKE